MLSLGGTTTELVRNDATGTWVTKNGDGSKVELIKDPAKANGDDDDERWVVTSRDGTRYHFGLNRLPGWAAGKNTTDSVLTVPVSGNQPGEPCYNSDFSASFCNQAWRWNLDYVEDTDGNAMSLWWQKESNFYAKNQKYTTPVTYNRGGYLTRIDYGQRSTTLFSAEPVARVLFKADERCFPEDGLVCSDAAFASRDYGQYRIWYDTPAHLHCSGAMRQALPGAVAHVLVPQAAVLRHDPDPAHQGLHSPLDRRHLGAEAVLPAHPDRRIAAAVARVHHADRSRHRRQDAEPHPGRVLPQQRPDAQPGGEGRRRPAAGCSTGCASAES